MRISRWLWVGVAVVVVVGVLAAALWLAGLEAASWVAGIVAAVALLVQAVRWAFAGAKAPDAAGAADPGGGAVTNTATGNVSGPLIQVRDFHGDITVSHGPATGGDTPRPDGEGTPGGRP